MSTTPMSDWEKEFAKIDESSALSTGEVWAFSKRVKDFIRNLLSSHTSHLRSQIEGMKKKQLTARECRESGCPYPNDLVFIHNQALESVLALLPKNKD